MGHTNCDTCGGTTQIGAPWAPDTCPECIDQPVVTPNYYQMEYRWNGGDTLVKGVVDYNTMREIMGDSRHVVVSCKRYFPVIGYATVEGCARCLTDEYVPHHNCRCGAGRAHCTSDYCY